MKAVKQASRDKRGFVSLRLSCGHVLREPARRTGYPYGPEYEKQSRACIYCERRHRSK